MRNYHKYYILFGALLYAVASMAEKYVIINQVMYDTPLNEQVAHPPYSNGEYVELYNGSLEPVALQGWKLKGEGITEHYLFPSTTVIPSNGFLVVAFRHINTPNFTLDEIFSLPPEDSLFQVIYQNTVVLSNQGETITLYNANQEIVDRIYYDGTSHLSNPDHLSAPNEDSIPGDLCVSLHRMSAEFDAEGRVIAGTSRWKKDSVSFKECQLDTLSFKEHYLTNGQFLSAATNFILSVSPLDPATRVSVSGGGVSVSSNVRTQTSIRYYDGLGRPIETIAMETTPGKNDLVQVSGYTGMNRATQQWLPVPMQTEGEYVDVSAIQSQNANNRPFTETLYENSALNRIVGHRQAGESYMSYPSTNTYSVNDAADDVRIYTIVRDSILKTTGENYAAHTLFKTTVADEDGKFVTTYTDKTGHLIAEERTESKTYYVYDELERLRYVLPNIDPNKLSYGEYAPNASVLRAAAYVYRYDDRGNMIYKRLPGCEPQHMVYDQARQLILTQDGNQRSGNKWTLFAYDSIGRNLYTAEIPLSQSHQDLIALFVDKWSVEHYGNNPSNKSISGTGYASTILGKNGIRLLTVNYYDDYDYIARREPASMRPPLRYSQESGYGQQYDNAIGLLTGTRIYNLSEEGYTAVSYYYDARGRVVQNRSVRSSDGYKTGVCTEYLFDGSIAHQLTVQGTEDDLIREHYRYTYDHAGRVTNTYYQLNNDAEIKISEFSYDSIGRLAQKLLHNSKDTITYSYDIRNMLTEAHNKHFSERLFYADNVSNFSHATPCFNGNISVARTLHADTSFTFVYSYDPLNRLTESKLETGGQTKPNEWFNYDAHGNITQLQRYSNNRLIDDLQFNYQENGNQLLSIRDDGEDADLYSTIEYHNAEIQADTTMYYDANGNLISDLDRGISVIKYNIFNLPDTIQFRNGNQIVYLYDASGRKYKSIIYTNLATAITPCYEIAHYTSNTDSVEYRITEYVDNIEYYYTSRDTTYRIFNAIGYYSDSTYYHYIKDHLGNICAVIHSIADSAVQSTKYYASGIPMAESTGRDEQPYLYNGKEFIEIHGLNEYDSKARRYYATIMRTTTMDPLAEKYYHLSPYAWCGNNPVCNVDVTGQKYKVVTQKDTKTIKAKIYTNKRSYKSARKAADFWNNQKGKKYTSKKSGKDYNVNFDIKVEIDTDPIGKANKDKTGNSYLISDMKGERSSVTGRTHSNRQDIEIRPERAEETTGAHEIGHILGLGHSEEGIMTPHPSDSKRTDEVTQENVDDIIEADEKKQEEEQKGRHDPISTITTFIKTIFGGEKNDEKRIY